ncbi:dynein axonemal intermediate chain 4 [Periplaneta americana]|uniref:dynein axonemal intermediate chain 4 n=1 Tax=Periplaneta americana TaxID=6978 RepID=UPI0037E723D0
MNESLEISSLFTSPVAVPMVEVDIPEFGFPITPRVKWKRLARVTVVLTETPTIFLFDRTSYTAEQDSVDGAAVEKDNKYYEYVTVGKGRFRKTNSTIAQTMDLLKKTRMTMAWATSRRSKSTYVSAWEMYDTYGVTEREKTDFDREPREGGEESLIATGAQDITKDQLVEDVKLTPAEQFEVIAKSEAFLDACAKMERLLASNVYRDEQKAFRGLMQPDPFRLNVEFKYKLKLLWSFTSDYVHERTVTGMCWNSLDTDLLAVGYGKYLYQERKNGLVCCWTIKNPTQPERKYKFDSPVTSVNFSKTRPNLLACGFYDGSVVILDVSSINKTIIAVSNRKTSPSYEPVWQIIWVQDEDDSLNEEIITCCQDGRISKYRREKTLNCLPMMWVSRMEGKVKGIDQTRKCKAHDIPVSRHPAALVLTRHPVDKLMYFVGTDEGCIHKCSTNNLHHHMDILLAHSGPVYSMQFSPFCPSIFLTSGGDWCIRIWTEDVGQPLLTLNTSMEPVLSAAWSPINATIIASINGSRIHFWDIRRKIFVPASTTILPNDEKGLMVQFTSSGLNLVVGGDEGAVHVYGLEDMPFSPFYQENALVHAIKKALITRPELQKELKNIGKPFY